MIRANQEKDRGIYLGIYRIHKNIFWKHIDTLISIDCDIDELKYILTLCLLLINDALDENDVELAFESFFQIESRIKREFSMFKNFYFDFNISYDDDEYIIVKLVYSFFLKTLANNSWTL